MKSKGILFSTPMVQAILDNRKTMTRRAVKPQPFWVKLDEKYRSMPDHWLWCGLPRRNDLADIISYAPYQPSDILYVKETWSPPLNDFGGCVYRATCWDEVIPQVKWRPSIFMPRAAARIWLKVTDVRCERLQEITPHDAWLEGCWVSHTLLWADMIPEFKELHRDMYRELWDSINMKRGYGWLLNPWVWVITFEPCDKPQEEPK